MPTTLKIEAPPDLENGFPRDILECCVQLPDQGVGAETGLIFYIPGYGSTFDDDYARNLLAFLANTYDCITASVRYFGQSCLSGAAEMILAPDFFVKLKEIHGLSISAPNTMSATELLKNTLQALGQSGMTELDPKCHMVILSDEYHSFGVLPALDHLLATQHILQTYNLNRKRLFVIGTSYGGFIASMLLKFAPHTFRMIIDNSGFSSTADNLSALYGHASKRIYDVSVHGIAQNRWSRNSGPMFFSDAHAAVRSLLDPAHITPSASRLYCYHSSTDLAAPTESKRRLTGLYDGKVPYVQHIITEDRLDGRIFKTLDHGMQASMRGIFEKSYEHYMSVEKQPDSATDFDLGTTVKLDCGALTYELTYTPEAGVRLSISEKARS